MEELWIALFLFSIGAFIIMVMAKRSKVSAFSIGHIIEQYAWGIFLILGGLFVLARYVYNLIASS